MTDAVVLVEDAISEDQRAAIIAPLGELSAARGFEFRPNPICLSLREDNRVVGGLIGHTNWDRVYIETISVATCVHQIRMSPSLPFTNVTVVGGGRGAPAWRSARPA